MKRLISIFAIFLTLNSFSQVSTIDSLNSFHLDNKPLFNELKGMLLFNSQNYYERDVLLNGGMAPGTDFIIIDGMRVNDTWNFPLLAIDELKKHQINKPLEFGNSLLGHYKVATKKNTGKTSIMADVTLPTLGLNTSFLGEDFFSSGVGDVDIEILSNIAFGEKNTAPSFLVAAKYATTNNPYPSAGKYKHLDEKLYNQIIESPLRDKNEYTYETHYITDENIIESNNPMNANENRKDIYARFNLPITPDINLSLGNYSSFCKRDHLLYNNLMFNYNNNPEQLKNSINSYLKFEHEVFNTENGSLEYTAQVNHQLENTKLQHPEHKDDFFKYGYVGKFHINRMDYYSINYADTIYTNYIYKDGVQTPIYEPLILQQYYEYTGKIGNGVDFEPSGINPILSNYTKEYYSFYDEGSSHYRYLASIMAGQGLINGAQPSSNYGIWNSPGYNHNLYYESSHKRIQILLNGKYSFNNHTIKAGFEHNINTYRYYRVNPVNLWGRARNLTNRQISQLDYTNPIVEIMDIGNGMMDTVVNYNYLYIEEYQSTFDKRLREKLGMEVDSKELIDVDNYSPSMLSIDMFSPDELLNNGLGYVLYQGYDPYGNKENYDDPYDFFSEEDDDIYSRPIKAFQPKYSAVYGDYSFHYDIFKLYAGARIERYNADQPVPKDPYLFYEAYTAGDVESLAGQPVNYPSNIEEDFILYVDDFNDPAAISAYRDGDKWYDADGNQIDGDNLYESIGQFMPYLKNPNDLNNGIGEDAFKDFEKVFTYLPKLHFEFESKNIKVYGGHQQFTVNPENMNMYNIPSTSHMTSQINAFNPYYYYFITFISQLGRSTIIPNPALEPIRKNKTYFGSDFLISEPQFAHHLILGAKTSFNTIKNMISYDQVVNAFPVNYYTYINSEELIKYQSINGHLKYFSTSEPRVGSGVDFTKNIYTSDEKNKEKEDVYLWKLPTNLMNAHVSLSWPQDARFSMLNNAAVKLFVHHRNGFEYKKDGNYRYLNYTASFTDDYEIDRLESFSTISLRMDKGFFLVEDKLFTNIYVLVSNLFNRVNEVSVYSTTGEPDDDGFLDDEVNQNFIISQPDPGAFKDQYKAIVQNPYNYGLARQIKLGIQIQLK